VNKDKNLSAHQCVRAILRVAKISYTTAPFTVGFKLLGIIIDAALPTAITYFAAATTTELVAAYSGDPAAGRLAITYVIITAVLGLITTVWKSLNQYVQELVRYNVESKVSDNLYAHFLALDFWQYDDKTTVDLYDKAQKFSKFFTYIFDRISAVLSKLITLIFSLVALFFFMPWIGVCALIAIAPGVFLQFKLSRLEVAHWNKSVDIRRVRSNIEYTVLQPKAIAEVRLHGLARHLLDLRQSLRERDEKQRLQYQRSYLLPRLLADALEVALEAGSLVWVVIQVIARQQPVGYFVFVQQIVSRALSSASGFADELSIIDEDLAHLFDYEVFMKLPVSSKNGGIKLQATPERITFQDVTFQYPQTERDVLKHINLTIRSGAHVAIVGENGAGKSTLMKLFTGLYQPTQGCILLDDVPLSDIAISSWHKQLSVLQQDFEQYIFTDIKNNVYFGDVSKPCCDDRVVSALYDAQAHEFVDKLPHKWSTYPSNLMVDSDGNKGIDLSGGQWQRLALARAFYRNAPILILDEPTSAIDALAEARIFNRLFHRSNERTVITVSHRLSTVEKADVIIMLEDGRVVEIGTHSELVEKRGRYYRMFESQIR
jgi:ATP-binding cassette, subfamily B, bacterial